MQTNFPVLDIFSRENLPMPKGYSFSGNIFISENQDIMPLLPQNGDAKLATKLIEKNLSEFSYNLDPNNEDYGVYFQNYFIGKYHAQLAYHMDIWPGNSEILDVKVHFPAFFTLSDNEQQDFFKKIENYGKIYKSFTWDFELDRSDIDAEKLQKFYNDFHIFFNFSNFIQWCFYEFLEIRILSCEKFISLQNRIKSSLR